MLSAVILSAVIVTAIVLCVNGTARFKRCKQLFENQHLLLIRDIWWSKL